MISFNKLIQMIVGTTPPIASMLCGFRANSFQCATNILTDAATLTPDCSLGEIHSITCANDNVRAFALPTNLRVGAEFETEVINTSGAGLTQTTWAATYKPSNPTTPATANRRNQRWRWDGTNAHLVFQTAADVAN